MHLDSIEWFENSPRVKLRPSEMDGRFVLASDQNLPSGQFIVMYDVRQSDGLAAELGDFTALRRYILLGKEPDTYHMVGSCALLDSSNALVKHFVDAIIQELPDPLPQ